MCGSRVSGPDGAHLTCCVIADGDDEIHLGGAGARKLIPAFAAQPVCGDASLLQNLESQGVGLLILPGATASGIGLESVLAHVIEQGLGQDAARRVVGAKEQNVQRGCGGHGLAARRGCCGLRAAAGGRLCDGCRGGSAAGGLSFVNVESFHGRFLVGSGKRWRRRSNSPRQRNSFR